jgi:ribosomal protein L27
VLHFFCCVLITGLFYSSQPVIPGNIIIRQRGLEYKPGLNVGIGKDFTLWALTEGWVHFTEQEKVPIDKEKWWLLKNKKKRPAKVCNVVQYDPNVVARMRYAQRVIENQERIALRDSQLAIGRTPGWEPAHPGVGDIKVNKHALPRSGKKKLRPVVVTA